VSTIPLRRRLFAGFVDDAAMFPPGNASAAVAVSEHLDHSDGWYADLVGPLLVSADRWTEFAAAHATAGSPRLGVALVGSTRVPGRVPTGVRVVGYEAVQRSAPLPLPSDGRRLAAELDPATMGADTAGHRAREAALDAVATLRAAGADVIAKVRTGGEVSGAFPSVPTLADVVWSAAAREVPLKFTAGLHHAVRDTDPTTGFPHHGFLNLLVATRQAVDGTGLTAVSSALDCRDGARLAAELLGWSEEVVCRVRGAFVSFGCCGVTDPIGDLLELGLVERGDDGIGGVGSRITGDEETV
jgi:hypothetical protein